MPEFPHKDFRLHVGWRTIKTAVSALLVNYFCPGPGSFPSGKGSKGCSRKAVRFECLTILDKTYIMKARKVLSCKMVSSLLANQRNDRSGWEVWGGHFLCQSSELCFVLGLSRKTSLAIIHVT